MCISRRSASQQESVADDDAINVAAEIFVKPIFYKMPTDLRVTDGQTSRLDSIVIGRPNPEVVWYHDGNLVHADRTHKIVVNQDVSDSGSYRCVAMNGGGEDSFEVSVNVTRE